VTNRTRAWENVLCLCITIEDQAVEDLEGVAHGEKHEVGMQLRNVRITEVVDPVGDPIENLLVKFCGREHAVR
jgi:hypothetical protein